MRTSVSISSMDRVSRRKFLKTASAGGAVTVSGCSSIGNNGTTAGSASGKTTLKMWTLFSGFNGKKFKKIAEKYNKNQNDVKVKVTTQPWDEYYTKMYTSMTGGNAPDVGIFHSGRLLRFSPQLVNLGDYVDFKPFTESLVNRAKVDGNHVGVPLDTHPMLLYYNKNIFEEANVDREKSIEDWNTFTDVVKKIKENTNYSIFEPGEGSEGIRNWDMWLTARGSKLLDNEMNPAFNNEDGLAATKVFDQMVEKNWTTKKSDPALEKFRIGKHAMVNNGVWWYGTLGRGQVDFDWGVTNPCIIKGKQKDHTWTSDHTIGVPKKKNRSEKKTKAAAEFAEWFCNHSAIWGKNGGFIPASKDALQSDTIQNSETWKKQLKYVYQKFVKPGKLRYIPRTKKNAQYKEAVYSNAIDAVRQQSMEPQKGLDKAEKRVDRVFK